MRPIAIVFCLVVALAGQKAIAEQAELYPNSEAFKDWTSTSNYMKSKGIDPATVNWQPIEPLCLGLKTDTNESTYNRCKYEKARAIAMYTAEKSQCQLRVEAELPESLTQKGRFETLRETDSKGVSHVYERTIEPIADKELQTRRSAAFTACMQALGWADANDWNLGRRCANP